MDGALLLRLDWVEGRLYLDSLVMYIGKTPTQHHAHHEDARREYDDRPFIVVGYFSRSEQQISDEQIQHRPKHIYCRRREAFTRRIGKGGGKRDACDTLDKVRNRICQKHTGKETRNVMIPFHIHSLAFECASNEDSPPVSCMRLLFESCKRRPSSEFDPR